MFSNLTTKIRYKASFSKKNKKILNKLCINKKSHLSLHGINSIVKQKY
jgi:hypothetical protein